MRIPSPILPSFAAAFLLGAAIVGAHELKDVSLLTAGGQTHVKLDFAPGPGEGEYPLYFQKADAEKGTLTLSFLETETAFPLGRHALDANAPEMEEITLKKVTSPSGKSFLGIELKLRQPPMGDAPVQPAPKNVLKVMFGKAANAKYAWSLAKALQAGDAYLSAKAEAPPKSAKANAARDNAAAMSEAAAASEPRAPSVPGEPGVPLNEEPAVAAPGAPAHTARLVEVKLIGTSAQENLLFVFDPPAAPGYSSLRNAAEPAWLDVTLEKTVTGLAKKEYPIPKSAVFKRIKTAMKGGKLQLRILVNEGAKPEFVAQDDGLVLSAPVKGSAAAFKWSTLKPEGLESENVAEAPDGLPSAHADGEALEAGHGGGGGKGLSSSRVFNLGMGGKGMVLTRDSASLKSEPGPKGKLIRKIPLGEKVEKLDSKGGNLRVVSGNDTGYIRVGEAVYADEITAAQEKGIQDRITAKQTKLEAAIAREAAAKAKVEAKAHRADSLATEAARKLAEKQAKKEADRQAKADAKAAAAAQASTQAPPDQIQEAAAATRTGKAMQGGQPDAGQPQGAGMGAPKLAIADNPELANKLAAEKLAAEEEKKRIEPEENQVSYNSYGRRDPFIPVEQGAADNGIDIDQMKVVGIIWQSSQPMAVLEHNHEAGVSYTVKEGDPVHNGRVARISHDAVTFDISEYGISRSYSLKLVSSNTAKEGAKK